MQQSAKDLPKVDIVSKLAWKDCGSEVIVSCGLEADNSKGDVKCWIRKQRLTLTVAGVAVCDGAVLHPVDPEESTWQIEDDGQRRVLVVTLVKCFALRDWPTLWEEDENENAEPTSCRSSSGYTPSHVVGSSHGKGDPYAVELAENQLRNEQLLEPRYLELLRERGIDDEETLDTFFNLFDEKIQLYRLDELDRYLQDIVPACRKRTDQFRIKGLQSLAFVRFKQDRAHDAIDLNLEIESIIGHKEAALSENLAMMYLSIQEFEEAEARYREALRLSEAAGKTSPSSLLGLGVTYERSGRQAEALPLVQKGYDYYCREAGGRPSSLQAKAGVQLAGLKGLFGDSAEAEALLREAIPMYEVTCGEASPLLTSPLRSLGGLVLMQRRTEEARRYWCRAYEIFLAQDLWNMNDVLPLHMALMSSHMGDTVDRTEFRCYFDLVDRGVARIRAEEARQQREEDTSGPSADGAVYRQLASEVKAWGGDYKGALTLLREALPLIKAAHANGVLPQFAIDHAEELMAMCEKCSRGEVNPPTKLSTRPDEDKEWAILRPPTFQAPSRPAQVEKAEASPGGEHGVSSPGGVTLPARPPLLPSDREESCVIEELPDEDAVLIEELLAKSEVKLNASVEGATRNYEQDVTVPTLEESKVTFLEISCRELTIEDYPALEALWSKSCAVRTFPSKQDLARHLRANVGLSFVGEIDGQVHCAAIASADGGLFGTIRQVLVHPSLEAAGHVEEARRVLLERATAELRAAGCRDVDVFVPHSEAQVAWDQRASGPPRFVYAI